MTVESLQGFPRDPQCGIATPRTLLLGGLCACPVFHQPPYRDHGQLLLSRGPKKAQGDSRKMKRRCQEALHCPPAAERDERCQKLEITTIPALPGRFKLSWVHCKALCRPVFLICYVSVTPVLVHSYTNSCGNQFHRILPRWHISSAPFALGNIRTRRQVLLSWSYINKFN